MTKRKKFILAVCVSVIAIPLLSAIAFVGFVYYSFPDFNDQQHLPDEVLIQNFYDHREEFEHLRLSLERDEFIHRIDDNWTDPPNIAREKVAEYRRLFSVIGTPRGIYNRRNPLRIEFWASTRGMVTSGSAKGYLYSEERPEEVVDDLDKFHNGSRGLGSQGRRHIEGNWYLFFDR